MNENVAADFFKRLFSRRTFLTWWGAGTALLLAACKSGNNETFFGNPVVSEQTGTASFAGASRVVVVRDGRVTTWDGVQAWYGSDSFVDQARIDGMVREGVVALTGADSEASAWRALLPGYSAGSRVAVKMNENNAGRGGNVIDPLPQLLKSLVRGLRTAGIAEADIWFLEPSRAIDERVAQPVKAAYPGVLFYGASATAYSSACTYTASSTGLMIDHAQAGVARSRLPDQLGQARYLIHLPILKAHGMAGVTLTYKNLFGLFEPSTISKFHNSFSLENGNPLVEIYANGNVGGKTALILADAVYGSWTNNYSEPQPWSRAFGGDRWPKRIFLSRDPVAMDSVLYDFLQWQRQDLTTGQEAYLREAARRGQGIRDHWNNPTERKYALITLVEKEMPA